jgi:hypothetical protein
MMAGCLLAVLCYLPIYRAMQHAAGNNVVGVVSIKDKVTGAVKLTPMAPGPNGALKPAPVAAHPNMPILVLLIFVQVLFVCMVYGPIAAYLSEAFPAKVRYTSLSLPYHIGNGVFGGLVPVVGLSTIAATGNIYAGLDYPMAVAAMTFVVGSILLPETHGPASGMRWKTSPVPPQPPTTGGSHNFPSFPGIGIESLVVEGESHGHEGSNPCPDAREHRFRA